MTVAARSPGIGSVHGTSRSRAFDRWFRYPAGFSAQALQIASQALGPKPRRIIDPFVGSAAGASALGDRTLVGIEAHPLIADLAATKLASPPGLALELIEHATAIVQGSIEDSPADITDEAPLVKKCFKPDVLQELVGLREAIQRQQGGWERYLRWALLGTLRDVATVKVGWPYQRPGVARQPNFTSSHERFAARARMMKDDLSQRDYQPSGRIVRGDSRSATCWTRAADGELFDASLTSPPYLNNFDYADATRLELFFIGMASSWAEMCSRVRSDMVIATTQQSSVSAASRAVSQLQRYPSIFAEVEGLTSRLKEERDHRDRGKEYNQVLPTYFADMARVLSHMYTHSRPGAVSAWMVGDSAPYGVYVDTPRLIASLAGDIGFAALSDLTVRSRGLRWRTNGTRHQVPLTERLVTFRKE